MWFPLVAGIITFICFILYAIFSDFGGFSDVLAGFIIAIIVTSALFIISLLGGRGFEVDEVYNVESEPIVALKDNSNTSGFSYLGSGHIEEDLYYYYFTNTENHGKELHKTPAEQVTLYDNEKENPRIETKYMKNSNPIINFFFITDKKRYDIYIPEGSIDYSFSVDLE